MFYNLEKAIDEYADTGIDTDAMRRRADELGDLSSALKVIRVDLLNEPVKYMIDSDVVGALYNDIEAFNERLFKLAEYCEKQSRFLFDVADETEEEDLAQEKMEEELRSPYLTGRI